MRTLPACLALASLALPFFVAGCQTPGPLTIGDLRQHTRVKVQEEKIDDLPGKAMESYRRFLDETPDSPLKAEAIRRLADLKAEREYGLLSGDAPAWGGAPAVPQPVPERPVVTAKTPEKTPATTPAKTPAPVRAEARKDAGNQDARTTPPASEPAAAKGPAPGALDMEGVGAREAIGLYTKLLKEYPAYEHTDQVLYQLSRAYEELGQIDEAIEVMGRLAREYPQSRHFDELQFRRGEYYFTRRRYLDAEETYGSIVARGAVSSYYQLALYKMGWALYKQDLYEKALEQFMAFLDHKVATGYDFAQTRDEPERKRMEDTFRVISLSFTNLGGADAAVSYFGSHGRRRYEDAVFSSLAEFYVEKQRYSDAVATYGAFINRDPYHAASPRFQMRVIEIQLAGGFPSLAVDAKKRFADLYGVNSGYWRDIDRSSRPDVLAWLKTNLVDLAKNYHALYQSPKQARDKQKNFEEAVRWYREYVASFPSDPDTPAVNYELADLYLENRSFDLAAEEYETTSYRYSNHERSAQAGYEAVYAWRQHLAAVAPDAKAKVKKEVVRSSIQFAVAYPGHEKAAIVLGAAVDDLYVMQDYELAATASRRLVDRFPRADAEITRRAWLVNGHANYELLRYAQAEDAYAHLLELLPDGDKEHDSVADYLASAIYKQGEEANGRGDYQAAAAQFLKIGSVAPASKIRLNAEYDGAAALIAARDWAGAIPVLTRFRGMFPESTLQPEVTQKLAYAYRETGKYAEAADEYERMERESGDDQLRRDALLTAAELHEKAGSQVRALAAYRRFAGSFPHPAEPNLEARDKIAEILRKMDDRDGYAAELKRIVAQDKAAGAERTPRTRQIAARAALVLAQQAFERFAAVKLVEPFEANLTKKKDLMKAATQQFTSLTDYEIGDLTAAAAFYLAEIYADFSRDLKDSERPKGLSPLEREEYDLAIEEQAYPFEEKAIATHRSNLELVPRGVYNEWIDKSLQQLARLVPARYDKPEEESIVIHTPDMYVFAIGQTAGAGGAGKAGGTKGN